MDYIVVYNVYNYVYIVYNFVYSVYNYVYIVYNFVNLLLSQLLIAKMFCLRETNLFSAKNAF